MAVVIIDGQELHLADHERLNGIQAASRLGIKIPHYCWHPGLSVVASCRMCLVESGTKDATTGKINLLPRLVPACQTPAKDGTVFVTNSEKVKQSHAFVEECLLIDHPIDCPICDKAGECSLQDYHFEHGQESRRADVQPFHSRSRDLGETVKLFVDRCVMCSRCVRFTREISGTSELMVIDRGSHEEIDVFPGFPLANKLSGNVVDLCPVGALGDRDFLYQQRVWYMKSHDGLCTSCATGCSIHIDENQGQVYRLKPRENPHVNQYWICDEGRYNFHYLHDEQRIVGPWQNKDGTWSAADWVSLPLQLKERLTSAGKLAGVLSPFLTVEEAYRLCLLLRQFDPNALLTVGPIPTRGTDERFKSGFTIRAEKCPNRKGVQAVVQHFGGTSSFADFLKQLPESGIRGAWVAGGYDQDWITDEQAAAFASLDTLIVQDLFGSPLSERAHFVLPATAFPEKAGSYVNAQDRLQSAASAIRPTAGIRTEASLYALLLGLKGQPNAADVLAEVVREVVFFAAARGPIPEHGVDLKLNQLAATM